MALGAISHKKLLPHGFLLFTGKGKNWLKKRQHQNNN
jgi:hypothetical protein